MNLNGRNKLNHHSMILALLALFALPYVARAQITTSQYDNARTGAYLTETALNPRNVNPQQFGKLFTAKVDGDVYAQPLVLAGVQIPGKGRHDVLFVVTAHDSVYAFDAYGNPSAPLWHITLLNNGETTLSPGDVDCGNTPEIGIAQTPVIDAKTGTIYILARSKNSHLLSANQYYQRLHALDVATGAEKPGSPIEINAAVQGKGDGSTGGNIAFDPVRENPRAALLLANNAVYLTWASSCDLDPYHGWIMAYDARTLKQKAVFNTSPDAGASGIWASDTGPAADKDGNLFVATGNGRFDVAREGRDFGDTLLKLRLDGQTLAPIDYFTPFNADDLARYDNDLGSGGVTLLPDQPGPHPHLAVVGGKAPLIYLVDRDNLGRYHPGDNTHAVQTIKTPGGIYGAMAYWDHNIYVLCNNDVLRDFEIKDGQLDLKATSTFKFAGHSATPVVSANGSKDGIVWLLRPTDRRTPDTPAVLYAVDASNVAHTLYSSDQNRARDSAGDALIFNIPTVVNGHVYVPTKREINVYGLLPEKH